jgi:hypothetical protein
VAIIFPRHAAVIARAAVLHHDGLIVVYDPPLEAAAEEVVRMFPILRQQLESFLGWRLAARPQVLLVGTHQTFKDLSRNEHIVAFAVPEKNVIVIDYTRMSIRPFRLSITLKHEMCHLLLHEHIKAVNLPKWLDEGVCQWVSDGIGEILIDKSWSGLDAAVMAGHTYRLSRLAKRFPGDRSSLMLAYEQSKSVVTYIDRQYGQQAVIAVLDDLKNGESIETALFQNLARSENQLEEDWLKHLEHTPRWLVFLANNIYGILFFLAAVLTVFGFVRLMLRRKKFGELEDEEKNE